MRGVVIILLTFLAACNSNKSTDAILAEVWDRDQSIRQQMIELTKAVTVDGRTELVDSLIDTSEAVNLIDAKNMSIVDSIMNKGLGLNLTPQSYKTIWIVIDHASLDKQEQYLPLMEKWSQDGLIGKDEYAVLYDRVAMKNNRPQRYGSQTVQFGINNNTQLYVYPVENPNLLDSLRASVGLSSMADYLELLTKTTGIDAKYNPEISIEQLNTMQNEDKN